MSSTGQAVGMVVGGVVGFFAGGNVALGASIGGAIGGYIDPPKGPKGNPPSADQLRMQTSAYGVALGRGYGRYARTGNLFWIEGNTLVAVEVEGQGGGKGGASVPPTYEIYGTFALGFGEGEIAAFRRLWFGSKLVYDAGSDSLSSIIASNDASGQFSFYLGGAGQLPDPRIQADLGVANTPAWRGLHYVVVKDWPMADFGNTLAGLQVKAEIVTTETATGLTLLQTVVLPANGGTGPGVAAQSMVNERYDVFAFNDPLYSGYPSGGDVGQRQAGFLAGPVEGSVHIPGTNTGTIFINNSPTYIGTLTRDGQTTDKHYFLDGVEMGSIPAAYQAEGFYIWVEEGGASFIGIGSGPDTAGPGTGDKYLVRTDIATGTVQTAYLMAYNVFNQRPAIVVVGGIGYAIGKNFTYVFDLGTLAVTDTRASAIISVAVDYSATVDDTGRVWAWLGGGTTGVKRLNATLTDYDLTIDTGYGCPGVAVRNGILYTAHFYLNSDITCRAYRIAGTTPGLVELSDIVEAECLSSGLLEAADVDVSALTQDVRGYRVGEIGAIRNALTPLQSAWPFDVIPHGYQIKCVPRGQSAVATIPVADLGAVAGNDQQAVRLTAAREMDSQLPRRVQVSYIDANREYDIGAGPGAERLNTDAVNVQQVDLGIVLTANEAAGIEESLLYMYWLERVELSFVLPPTYLHIEPADVVDVVDTAATYNMRLTSINYLPDGRLECTARFNNPAVYSPTAVGQEGLYTGQPVKLLGASQAIMLDIPCLDISMNVPGITAGMRGYIDGWQGGTLFRSDDGGNSFNPLEGFTSVALVVGTLLTALGVGRTDIKDSATVGTVTLYQGALFSVTEAQMFNGQNLFAIGAPGRWEIVGIQNASQNADYSWTVRDLLRGRYGTEFAVSQHAAGDLIVKLDTGTLKFITWNTNSLYLARLYRAVTFGRSIDTASDQPFTYEAVNLKPLAPVYAKGSIDISSNTWNLSATRRTRIPVEPFSGQVPPIGETYEKYDLEIFDTSFTSLKRTFSDLPSPSAQYSSALQVSDFGSVQTSLGTRWRQKSDLVGRGYPLSAVVSSAAAPYDPYAANVVLGLHFDGANNSTTFTDVKGKTISVFGGAKISTTWSQFGGASGVFSTAGDYITAPASADFDPGAGDYTLQGWIRPTSISGAANHRICGTASVGGGNNGLCLYINAASQLVFSQFDGAVHWNITGPTVAINTPYYIAVIKSGSTTALWVNGTSYGSNAGTYAASVSAFAIGRMGDYAGQYYIGFADDFLLTKGVARPGAEAIPSSAFVYP